MIKTAFENTKNNWEKTVKLIQTVVYGKKVLPVHIDKDKDEWISGSNMLSSKTTIVRNLSLDFNYFLNELKLAAPQYGVSR